jgi:hypothetical protein
MFYNQSLEGPIQRLGFQKEENGLQDFYRAIFCK